jgi:Fe-S cluster assembly iron-binding protein IscA
MLQLSEDAVVLLDAAKRQYRIPLDYGIRVSGAPTASGDLALQIDFTDGPDDGDVVEEQHGAMVFVAAEVAEPLADAELDVSPSVSGDGQKPVTLVLRQDTDDT